MIFLVSVPVTILDSHKSVQWIQDMFPAAEEIGYLYSDESYHVYRVTGYQR